jgi:hypothetical protein
MTVDGKALGALAVACVIAAGGGAYLAVRYGVQRPSSEQAATGPASDRNLPASDTVTETEGLISASTAPSPERQATGPADNSRPVTSEAPRAGTTGSARKAQASRPGTGASAPAAGEAARVTGLDRPWPSGATGETAATPTAPAVEVEHEARPVAEVQPAAPEPPQRLFEDLVVPAESVIGLQIEMGVTSETARIEDRVRARVTRDVKVGDQVAIPAGSRAEGSITQVDRGGKFKETARLGVRFHTLVLADGTRLTLNTETVFRDGLPPSGEAAAKVGGAAVGGAILGAILGGTRGAVVGGTVGAAGSAAAVAASERNAATLPAGATLTVRLTSPVTVTIEK